MFQLERGEQAGDPIVLQLVAQGAIEIAGQRSAAGNPAGFGKQLPLHRERHFLGAHGDYPTPSRM
ncbi:MAG TPA: hypothetical protein VKY89_03125, partial [Thermoanaerobaculia bacterium]|nr:hypothetical protein [Thermoanaerobaculia bacterium]